MSNVYRCSSSADGEPSLLDSAWKLNKAKTRCGLLLQVHYDIQLISVSLFETPEGNYYG